MPRPEQMRTGKQGNKDVDLLCIGEDELEDLRRIVQFAIAVTLRTEEEVATLMLDGLAELVPAEAQLLKARQPERLCIAPQINVKAVSNRLEKATILVVRKLEP